MLLVGRPLSKIYTTETFEIVHEPNIVAHITEQSSHFPWQRKKQRKRETQAGRQRDGEERKNNHLKPFKPFNIHDRRDCGGSHKVWDIKPPKRL